jgi:DNA-binding transcriptional regulator YbjK
MTTAVDGRRARGAARRERLVRATLEVIERDGLAGLSHRAIAEQAGVSLASASYHFAGIDDLVATALTQTTEELTAALRADDGDRSLARLARMIAEEVADHRGRLVAEYELYLLALRRAHLRPQALAWLDVIADSFAPELDGAARRAFRATVEGVCLHALFDDGPPDAEAIERTLTLAWPRP